MNFILHSKRVIEDIITGIPRSEVPARWGRFHLISISIVIFFILSMVFFRKKIKDDDNRVKKILLVSGVLFIMLETAKQLVCSYEPVTGIWRYDYLRFPFQFCSIPIWLCPIGAFCGSAGRRRICSFLASFGVFAGIAVLILPSGSAFSENVFLNFHTMVWHGLMVVLGVYMWLCRAVRPSLECIYDALIVYLPQCPLAAILNEAGHTLNIPLDLFHFSPYFNTDIPVLSLVQQSGAGGFVMMISFMTVFGILGVAVFAFAWLFRALFNNCRQ